MGRLSWRHAATKSFNFPKTDVTSWHAWATSEIYNIHNRLLGFVRIRFDTRQSAGSASHSMFARTRHQTLSTIHLFVSRSRVGFGPNELVGVRGGGGVVVHQLLSHIRVTWKIQIQRSTSGSEGFQMCIEKYFARICNINRAAARLILQI